MGRAGQSQTELLATGPRNVVEQPRSRKRKRRYAEQGPVRPVGLQSVSIGRTGWRRLREDLDYVWAPVSQMAPLDRAEFERYFSAATFGVRIGGDQMVADAITREGIPVSLKTQINDTGLIEKDEKETTIRFCMISKTVTEVRRELKRKGKDVGHGKSNPNAVAAAILAGWNERYDQDCDRQQEILTSKGKHMKPLKPGELRIALLRGNRPDGDWRFRYYEWRIGRRINAADYDWTWGENPDAKSKTTTLVGKEKKTGEKRWSITTTGMARIFFHARLDDRSCLNDTMIQTDPRPNIELGILEAKRRLDLLRKEAKALQPVAVHKVQSISRDFNNDITKLADQAEAGKITIEQAKQKLGELTSNVWLQLGETLDEPIEKLGVFYSDAWSETVAGTPRAQRTRRAQKAVSSFLNSEITQLKELKALHNALYRTEGVIGRALIRFDRRLRTLETAQG